MQPSKTGIIIGSAIIAAIVSISCVGGLHAAAGQVSLLSRIAGVINIGFGVLLATALGQVLEGRSE